jgi:hypothetical protein
MLDSLYLEIVRILTQVGALFAMNVPQTQKSFGRTNGTPR